ncbi:MAG: hypothetical protein ACI849_000584 [Patiriisocius sp.]|jgi:hypothetical protein
MKKIAALCILFCLSSSISYGQYWDKLFQSDLIMIDTYIKRNDSGISYKDTRTYKGTPYNNASYLLGTVYKNDALLATNVALRYNAIADEIEIKESLDSPDENARVLTKSQDIYVKIINEIFVFVPYEGGVEKGGYFSILYEGSQISLYKKMNKKFTAAKKASSSLVRDMPAKFEDAPVYYIVNTVGKFYQFPKSRKGKFKVFGSTKKLIKEYTEVKNLDINNEADLKKVIEYYNTVGGLSAK